MLQTHPVTDKKKPWLRRSAEAFEKFFSRAQLRNYHRGRCRGTQEPCERCMKNSSIILRFVRGIVLSTSRHYYLSIPHKRKSYRQLKLHPWNRYGQEIYRSYELLFWCMWQSLLQICSDGDWVCSGDNLPILSSNIRKKVIHARRFSQTTISRPWGIELGNKQKGGDLPTAQKDAGRCQDSPVKNDS